jgi:hypothetical protein
VRCSFLPFVPLAPFGVWFLKAMGLRVGECLTCQGEPAIGSTRPSISLPPA